MDEDQITAEPPDINSTEPSLQRDKVEVGEEGQFDKALDNFLDKELPPEGSAEEVATQEEQAKQRPPDRIIEKRSQPAQVTRKSAPPEKNETATTEAKIHPSEGKRATNDFGMMKALEERDQVTKASKANVEPSKEAPKAQEPAKEEEKKAEQPKSIEDEFPIPANARKETQEGWKKMRSTLKTRDEAIAKLAQEVVQMRQSQVNGVPKQLLDEVAELRAFRGAFDVTSSPDFQKNYLEPLIRNKEDINTFLEAQGLSKERTQIGTDANGNPIMMPGLDDVKNMGIDKIDPRFTKAWHNSLVEKGNIVDAQKFLNMLTNNESLQAKHDQAKADAPKRVEEYRQQRQQKFDEEQKQVTDYAITRVNEMQKMVPWGQPKEVPANATPEERALIEKHNNWYKMAEETFGVAWNPRTPQQRVEASAAAALSRVQAEEIKELQSHNETLKQELARFRKAGTINRQASAATSKPVNQAPVNRSTGMRDEDEVEAGMRAIGI